MNISYRYILLILQVKFMDQVMRHCLYDLL